MATPAAEGSAACAASATWLCGVLAGLADTEMLFSRSPWVGFIVVAAIGGFIGWCILAPVIIAVACYFIATIVAVIRAFRGP